MQKRGKKTTKLNMVCLFHSTLTYTVYLIFLLQPSNVRITNPSGNSTSTCVVCRKPSLNVVLYTSDFVDVTLHGNVELLKTFCWFL